MRFNMYWNTPGVFANEEDSVILLTDTEDTEPFDAELVSVGPREEGAMRLNAYSVSGTVEHVDGFRCRSICKPHLFDHLGHVPLYLKLVKL